MTRVDKHMQAMDVSFDGLFDRFAPAIASLNSQQLFERQDLLNETFQLASEGHLEIFYAPFDYLNPDAKLVLMGITPGWAQMQAAYREAALGLQAGASALDVCSRAKRVASFAGPMRLNLVAMLDGLDMHLALGIGSTALLFDVHWFLLHTTSAIRYPTFLRGQNYIGHSPSLLRTPTLLRFVVDVLAPELAIVPNALVVPLGSTASEVTSFLIKPAISNLSAVSWVFLILPAATVIDSSSTASDESPCTRELQSGLAV